MIMQPDVQAQKPAARSKFLSGFLLGVTVAGVLYYFNRSQTDSVPMKQQFRSLWQRLGDLLDELLDQLWQGEPLDETLPSKQLLPVEQDVVGDQSNEQSVSRTEKQVVSSQQSKAAGGRRFFVKRGRSLNP